MEKTTIIAVYGTLKEGHGNYTRLLGGAKKIASQENTATEEKYAMYSGGIPYVVEDEKKTRIKVDVFEIDSELLKRVDALEGYRPNDIENSWYVRKEINIIQDDPLSKQKIKAWLYFNNISQEQRNHLKFHKDGKF